MRRRASLMILALLAAPPALAASPAELPPLHAAPTAEQHTGKMIFAELVAPDLAAAKTFYGQLFGWSFQDNMAGPVDYASARLNGRMVATLVGKPLPPTRSPAWLTFISSPDVDGVGNLAIQHGAKLLFPPHDIPNLGRAAVLADPQGAVFAVLASSTGDSPDELAQPGDWIWSSLITKDPAADADFYQTLFHADIYDMPGDEDDRRFIMASDDFARASINPLPPDHETAHPYWLNYIRVTDAEATARQAVSLGARILTPPRVDRHGGKVAVLADPSGAAFGVMEWPQDATTGAAK